MDNIVILDRIDFNESRIMEILEDFKNLKKAISDNVNTDMFSEKHRIECALKIKTSIKDTAKLLQISERQLYREIIKYKITYENKQIYQKSC